MDIDSLNEKQRKAVITTDGPVLVLAGAGSGKTRVLTHRIAYMLDQNVCEPEQILAVTFTNKAAAEMKERVEKLLGRGHSARSMAWMGTFHSVCARILRKDGHHFGLNQNFTIYDPTDQLDVVKQVMKQLNISTKDVNPRAIHSHISSAKNEVVLPEDFKDYAKGYFYEMVAAIYPKYQEVLKQNNAVDFDDLLLYVVLLLKDYPEMLEKYQRMFQYILIDEYQDTNRAQYLLVTMLAEKSRNLCVVGDDDQSIYAFRGATIRNILNFERDYPEAKVIKLEQNYRSTKTILDAAYSVVSKNKGRTDKKLWTDNAEGGQVMLYTATDERDESEWVVRQIEQLVADSVHPEEIAVLYRTNAQSRSLEEGFIRRGVGYKIVGGVRFYERKEIKDVLAYLRAAHNPKDDTSLLRVINTPRRGIGPKKISELIMLSQDKAVSITELLTGGGDIPVYGVKLGTLFSQIIDKAQTLNMVELINFVLEQSGYLKMLDDGTSENEARVENLKELISVAAKYTELDPSAGLATFLEDVALIEAVSEQDSSSGTVTLMTIHAAKGLEFEYVFVVGMEEGLFPHSRVFTDPKELEEERRLAYVAITRAKQRLHLIHADSRVYFGSRQNNLISRFVEDIPLKLIDKQGIGVSTGLDSTWEEVEKNDWDDDIPQVDVQIGDKVKHEYFGVGKVEDFDESMITINFGPVYGTKELSRDFAPLQKL